jgi:hypothetical protein
MRVGQTNPRSEANWSKSNEFRFIINHTVILFDKEIVNVRYYYDNFFIGEFK